LQFAALWSAGHSTAQAAVCAECRCNHISTVLCELHWLHIRDRVKFKEACLVRQSLSGQAPLYLADCCLVSDSTRRSLQLADVSTCMVPRTLSSYGDRTFAATGPRLWNSLPVQLRKPDITYELFRRQLKGHLFREARIQHSVTSGMWRHRKTLTCLLTYLHCQLPLCDVEEVQHG